MDKDTLQGKTEKTTGHVKEVVGDVTGNNKLQAEGAANQAKGQLHETIGAAKQLGKDFAAGIKDGKRQAESNS